MLEGNKLKKIFFHKKVIGILVFMLLVSLFPQFNRVSAAEDTLNINAAAAILVDAETGRVLYEKNPDTVLGIASMTKMMTEYLLLEAIHKGKVSWDQEYSVSEYVYNVSQDYPALSNVPLRRDGVYTVHELYEAMTIYSANGATIALAEIIAGSETNFVKMMTEKANELGLKDFKFVNATGLNNSNLIKHLPEGQQIIGNQDEENVMSARAAATLAIHLIKDYPEILETTSIPVKVFKEGTDDSIVMENWNWMIPELAKKNGTPADPSVDGLKTGTTDFAGACFTGSAVKNGNRYITVVLNAGGDNPRTNRFNETEKLFTYAENNFKKEKILPKDYQVKGKKTLPVNKGKKDKVNIYTKDAIDLVMKNGEKDQYKPVLVLDKKMLNKDGELTAPLKKGDKVGYIKLEAKDDQELQFLGGKTPQVDVVVGEDVEKANWFVLSMRGIGSFFGDIWGGISSTVKGWF